MASRKIAECINVRINVGNYQHIELTKYAEEQVDYETKEELELQEDSLRDDLLSSLIRSMKVIPERLGKGVGSAQEVEEAIQKAIPEWLENSPVPNIANIAAKNNLSDAAEQKDNKDSLSKNLAEVVETPKVVDTAPAPVDTEDTEDEGTEDLFEEDEMPKSEKLEGSEKSEEVVAPSEETKTAAKPEKVEAKNDDLSSIFDEEDDDLFGNV